MSSASFSFCSCSISTGATGVRFSSFRIRCSITEAAMSTTSSRPANAIPIMVNDCSGKVGHEVARAMVNAGLDLVPYSLTGPGNGGRCIEIGNVKVEVRDIAEREDVVKNVMETYPSLIVVDYTLPSAVNGNAEFYCKHNLPFVMGTTGGDREKLLEVVRNSRNYAIIAPQMGKQVVAFVAAMEIMAEQFPGAFSGYKLQVTESHQSTKVDTSGTALSVISSFRKLGLDFDDDEVEMIRDPQEQVERMGVPVEYLKGHAFHTYRLVAPDGTVSFEFKHNVCGRSIYAQGTVDAALFLAKKIREQSDKRLFNMIDVLRGGSMR